MARKSLIFGTKKNRFSGRLSAKSRTDSSAATVREVADNAEKRARVVGHSIDSIRLENDVTATFRPTRSKHGGPPVVFRHFRRAGVQLRSRLTTLDRNAFHSRSNVPRSKVRAPHRALSNPFRFVIRARTVRCSESSVGRNRQRGADGGVVPKRGRFCAILRAIRTIILYKNIPKDSWCYVRTFRLSPTGDISAYYILW